MLVDKFILKLFYINLTPIVDKEPFYNSNLLTNSKKNEINPNKIYFTFLYNDILLKFIMYFKFSLCN